jgi:hypothetical protein
MEPGACLPIYRGLDRQGRGRTIPMLGKRAVDAELRRSLGLSLPQAKELFLAGGDLAERRFMECCWRLWKANGTELLEPFVDAAFNDLPERSRAVLFQRALTIVYVAQELEIKDGKEPATQANGT